MVPLSCPVIHSILVNTKVSPDLMAYAHNKTKRSMKKNWGLLKNQLAKGMGKAK